MSTLVIKSLPEPLYERLKEQARRNHRSLTKEAIALLERGVLLRDDGPQRLAPELPPLTKLPGGPLSAEWIERAIEDGRE